MKHSFEVYGQLAQSPHSLTIQSGRRNIQAGAEKLIPADVATKLGLLPHHTLLEIGCGPGALLGPLALRVTHVTGVDHPDVLAIARQHCSADNITLVAGRFPEVSLEGTFDRILVYSVLHYMPDLVSVEQFIHEALKYLKPQGRILLGDLPNTDTMRRFRTSEWGKKFEENWKECMKGELTNGDPFDIFSHIFSVSFSDEILLRLMSKYRQAGYNAYILLQSPKLPYGYTREDMLIQLL